jgi:isopentenyl diphosphate isomerase/L-lactate dehydrogenase-like FMN-dependent dehydrogenase
MFAGMDVNSEGVGSPEFTWEYVDRLKKMTRMKLLLKGIETREDAKLCVEHGVDGIVVSNHGGRAEESGRATIECLPEVVDAVGGRIPVLIDGGIRRGTDVFKALALGARAVGIGRPYIWGLAAFGQPGVERVVDILRTEFELTMRQCGARSLAEITRTSVVLNSGMMTPARG